MITCHACPCPCGWCLGINSHWPLTLWTITPLEGPLAWLCSRNADPKFLPSLNLFWPGILPLLSLGVGGLMDSTRPPELGGNRWKLTFFKGTG